MKKLIRFLPLALAFSMLLAFGITTFAAEDTGFTDVPADAGYAEAVRWVADHGYINGYGDGRFGINDNVTRAQLSAILYRAAGTPASSGISRFSDVSATAYYLDAASWAEDNGLINGYPDGRFGVDDPVTRQQVATILWRWAGSPDASADDYADEGGIAEYARTAVDWSRANSIMDPVPMTSSLRLTAPLVGKSSPRSITTWGAAVPLPLLTNPMETRCWWLTSPLPTPIQ